MRYDNYEPTQDVIVLGDVETTTWIPGSELRGRYRPAGYIVELNLLEERGTLEELYKGLSEAEKSWISKHTKELNHVNK